MRALAVGALLGAAFGGCGLFDIPITLSTEEYRQNFGSGSGQLDSVSCPMQQDPCPALGTQLQSKVGAGASVSASCDAPTGKCAAQLDATVSYPVTLANDQSFTSGVAGKAVSAVHSIILKYGVPKNTLSFAVPSLDVYIAPAGVTQVKDAQAVYMGKLAAIAAGQTSADGAASLNIDTSSPAGQKLVFYVQNPTQPFVLLLNTKPVFHANDPIPSGELVVRLTPVLTVGLPR